MRQKTFRGLVFFVTALFISSNANAGWDFSSLWNILGTGSETVTVQDAKDIEQLRHFPSLVAELELLHANMVALHVLAEATGMKVTPADMLWRELLDKKVLRQFRARKALGIVVAGGTKTGKSTVFNHLAGREISKVSHISAATKQAVLIVPKALYDLPLLQLLYPDMELVENASPQAATEYTGTKQKLLVRAMDGLPDDTMFIDVPDVDSNETTNWEKAYAVTRSSDVVIAMITPEKHSDHAIVEFFRKVAKDAGKPIVVVVNKVHQSQIDAKEWVDWLNLFCKGTGINPIAAYVVPFDQKASAVGKQDFFRVEGDLTQASVGNNAYHLASKPSVLREDVAELNVDTLKAQAQVGALVAALEGEQGGKDAGKGGIMAYLEEIRRRSTVYRTTLESFRQSTASLERQWPTPPTNLMVGSIGKWWDNRHRWEVTKSTMHMVNLVTLAFLGKKTAQLKFENELLQYREAQNTAIDEIISRQFAALTPVVKDSVQFLSPEASSLLGPIAQGKLLSSLKAAYRGERDPETDFETVAAERLPFWEKEHPMAMTLIHSADVMAHVVIAPVLTLTGIVGGLLVPGAVAGGVANNTASSLVASTAGSFTSGKVGGWMDTLGASVGVSALFNDFAVSYATLQLDWINGYIVTTHLGPMIAELEKGAGVVESKPFKDAEACAFRIGQWAKQFSAAGSGG
jgi:hypothetical protein